MTYLDLKSPATAGQLLRAHKNINVA